MNFEHTTLFKECEKIITSRDDPAIFYYEVEVRTPVGVHRPLKVMSIDITADYVRDYAPKIIVKLVFPYGEFNKQIRPHYENLKVNVRKSPDKIVKDSVEIDVQTYRGILVDIGPETNISASAIESSEALSDLSNLVSVDIELQEHMLEDIRTITTGTVLQSAVPGDALSAIVTHYLNSIDLDVEDGSVSFDMQPPANTTPQTQITIPHSVSLMDLGDFLQTKGGGIYNHDIASFLDKGSWYVWAPFDTSQQDYVEQTLVILLAPRDRYTGIEYTYRTTTRQTIVMITGERDHVDTTQNELHNKGTGIRFLNSENVLEGYATVEGNRVVADRSKNATEIRYDDNPTGKNRIRTVTPTSNIYNELSKVALSRGSYLSVVWENGNNDLIRPDMNVQVMLNVDGLTEMFTARILACNTYIQNVGEGIFSNRFATSVALSLFVEDGFGKIDQDDLDDIDLG